MSRQTDYPKFAIQGVEVDAITIDQSISYIAGWVTDSKRPAAYATKPYVEFVDQASGNPKIRTIINDSQLCLPDGVALQWAARYLYASRQHWWNALSLLFAIIVKPAELRRPLPEKFGGINFTSKLLEACRDQNLKVFLVGSPRRQTIRRAAEEIAKRWPGINIVGTFEGRFPANRESELVDLLRESKPQVILVGMGFPKQEELISRLVGQLDHGFLIGEGGSFDYREFGGQTARAPEWIQRIGLEWLWRLGLEPARFTRQLAIPRFIYRVYREGTSQNRPKGLE